MTASAEEPPVIVVGAGLAGLSVALRLAPQPCVVLSPTRLGLGAASAWAQGGLAAALGADDSPALHAQDTIAAGAGLCDPAVVRSVTAAAPEAVRWLQTLGARFDGDEGRLDLGLEGGHRRRRVVHAAGDGSGVEILRAVLDAVARTPSITVHEDTRVVELDLSPDGAVRGVLTRGPRGTDLLRSARVVLATGGSGGLWGCTTNPLTATGSGLALAARAGAALRDLEMVQLHPTALDVGVDPAPLVSEAVRGAGAVLVTGSGERLLSGDGDLAPRDVVARAVDAELRRGGRVLLDATGGVAAGFPALVAACRRAGLDPDREPVPVRPAAHYHCGGVLVDDRGRTTVPGLWAVGEVASTGLHGANRLASSSLLEAVVCGGLVAADLAEDDEHAARSVAPGRGTAPAPTRPLPARAPRWLRTLMDRHLGVVRDGPGLALATGTLQRRLDRVGLDGLDDPSLVALLVARSACAREESRGGHLRRDRPGTDAHARHTFIDREELVAPTATTVAPPMTARRSA